MGNADSPKIRRDGWTVERQLGFLAKLAETNSVARAAASVGMSRESAYRLRGRGALFAALWGRIIAPPVESHTGSLSDGRLARLLGTHFRRQHGDFLGLGGTVRDRAPSDRT